MSQFDRDAEEAKVDRDALIRWADDGGFSRGIGCDDICNMADGEETPKRPPPRI